MPSILKSTPEKKSLFTKLFEKLAAITILSGATSLICYLFTYYYKQGFLYSFGLSMEWFPVETGTVSPTVIYLIIAAALSLLPESMEAVILWCVGLLIAAIIFTFMRRTSKHQDKIRLKRKNALKHSAHTAPHLENKSLLTKITQALFKSEYFLTTSAALLGPFIAMYAAIVVLLLLLLLTGLPFQAGKKEAAKERELAKKCVQKEGQNIFPCIEVYKDRSFERAGVFVAKSNTDFAIFDATKTATYGLKDFRIQLQNK